MIRMMTPDDNAEQVANLIYETDEFVFNLGFGKKPKAVERISTLLQLEHTEFSSKNVMVDVEDGDIRGIVLAYNPNDIDAKRAAEEFGQLFSPFEGIIATLKTLIIRPLLEQKEIDGIYIQNVCVDSRFRSKGIGGALLNAYFEHARTQGANSVWLDVFEENTGAKALYERKGFVDVSQKKLPFTKFFVYRMRKPL